MFCSFVASIQGDSVVSIWLMIQSQAPSDVFAGYYVRISVKYGSLSLFTLNLHSFSHCTTVLETLWHRFCL